MKESAVYGNIGSGWQSKLAMLKCCSQKRQGAEIPAFNSRLVAIMIAIVTPPSGKAKSQPREFRIQFSVATLMAGTTAIAIILGLLHVLNRETFSSTTPAMAIALAMCLGALLAKPFTYSWGERLRNSCRWLKGIKRTDVIGFAIGYVIAFLIVPFLLYLFK